MPDVYAQTFQLDATGPPLPQAISETLATWLKDRWPQDHPWFRFDEASTVRLPDGSTAVWEPWAEGTRSFLDFTMRQPTSGESKYVWRTRATLMGEGEFGTLQLRVENAGPDFGLPGAELTMRPRVALILPSRCRVHCDGRLLPAQPSARTVTGDAVVDLLRYDLLDPQRADPVVVVSPRQDGTFATDPERLASLVSTTASVAVLATPDDTWTITHELGSALSVFLGALRVYLPGLTRASHPLRHPLILPHRFEQVGEPERLAKWLALLTTRRFRDDPRRLAWRDQMQLADSERRATRKRQLDDALRLATENRDAAEILRLYEEEIVELRGLLESRDAQVSALEELVRQQDAKIQALLYNLNQREAEEGVGPGDAGRRVASLEPDTVFEAVEIAAKQYSPQLLILDSALESAMDSDFHRPEQVLEQLDRLASVASLGRSGGLGKSLLEACKERGLDYRSQISRNSSEKIKAQHVFSDGTRDYYCQEHIALGGGRDPKTNARIYLSSESLADGVLVIGYVGRHLDSMTTN